MSQRATFHERTDLSACSLVLDRGHKARTFPNKLSERSDSLTGQMSEKRIKRIEAGEE